MSRFKLYRTSVGLFLEDRYSHQKPLIIDFSRIERRLKQAGRRTELLVQAVKPREGLRILDCTAGLGNDALILAYLGCEVTLIERSRVISYLLEDAILRARDHHLLSQTAERMELICADSISVLASRSLPDVVYLDPMFPSKKGSALVKGPMQVLQRYLGPDLDSEKLLDAVLQSGVKKTVVKRPPRNSDWNSRMRPTQVVESRNARFEIYFQ